MELITSSLRLTDLANTCNSTLDKAERIIAWNRLPAERISRIDGGLLIDQHDAPRRWQFASSATVRHSHLIDLAELDEYGVHAPVSNAIGELPAGEYIALCPWPGIPQATQYLRSKCLGPAIEKIYHNGTLRMHVSRALSALQIPERPANDVQLPSHTKIRSGTLLRLDASTAGRVIDYFNLIPVTEPTISELGGDAFIVYATSNALHEPLRILLTDHWDLQGAHRELTRWLKSSMSRNRNHPT